MSLTSLRRILIMVAALVAPFALEAQTAQPPAGAPTKPVTPPATAVPKAATPTAAPAAATAGTPARDARGRFISKKPTVTATCTDGTTWSGKTRSGACARHGGVKRWN